MPDSLPTKGQATTGSRQNKDAAEELVQEVEKIVVNSFPKYPGPKAQNPGQQSPNPGQQSQNPGQQSPNPGQQSQNPGQQSQINQVQNQQYNEQSGFGQTQPYQPSPWGPGQQSWGPGQQNQQYGQSPQWGQGRNSGGSNPCCCKLESGVLCAAIYGIIFYAISGLYFGLILASIPGMSLGSDYDFWTESDIGKAYMIMMILSMLIGLVTSIVLTVGAKSKSAITVKVGFAGFILEMLLFVVSDSLYIMDYSQKLDDPLKSEASKKSETNDSFMMGKEVVIGCGVLGLLISLAVYGYVLYVIWVYMGQLTRDGQKVGNIGGGQSQPAYGQFPVGVPPPSQQQSYYQPAAPTTGYSQATMNPGYPAKY